MQYSKRYNFMLSPEEAKGEELLKFSVSDLKCEMKKALLELQAKQCVKGNEAACQAQVLKFARQAEKLCEGCKAQDDKPPSPWLDPVKQGGIPYNVSHEQPTPIMSENAKYNEANETAAADGNRRQLRSMALTYTGANPSDKKEYDGFHHSAAAKNPLYPQAVRKIAKQLNITDESGSGVIPTKSLTSSQIAVAHISKHLQECNDRNN